MPEQEPDGEHNEEIEPLPPRLDDLPPPPTGQRAYLPPSWNEPEAGTAADELPLAGYGWRAGGFLIDGLLLAAISALLVRPFDKSAFVVFGMGAILQVLYGGLLIGFWNGQTVGMKIVRIRCVDLQTRGKVTPPQALVRALSAEVMAAVGAVLTILIVVEAADLLWPIWDAQNQTLHDKIGRTVVVRPA